MDLIETSFRYKVPVAPPRMFGASDLPGPEKYALFEKLYTAYASARAFKEAFTPDELKLLCHKQGVYGILTSELRKFLLPYVPNKRRSVEIGSGRGVFCSGLDIPGTDNHIQLDPMVAIMYRMQGQPTIRYGGHVINMDAESVVKDKKPQVVFGSWITAPEGIDGLPLNMYGPTEEVVLQNTRMYLMYGNLAVHQTKRILRYRHLRVQADWMLSRGSEPSQNCLFIWSDDLWADDRAFEAQLHFFMESTGLDLTYEFVG